MLTIGEEGNEMNDIAMRAEKIRKEITELIKLIRKDDDPEYKEWAEGIAVSAKAVMGILSGETK